MSVRELLESRRRHESDTISWIIERITLQKHLKEKEENNLENKLLKLVKNLVKIRI
jgi:hypothetical protein